VLELGGILPCFVICMEQISAQNQGGRTERIYGKGRNILHINIMLCIVTNVLDDNCEVCFHIDRFSNVTQNNIRQLIMNGPLDSAKPNSQPHWKPCRQTSYLHLMC
jgi:hypothetical protein